MSNLSTLPKGDSAWLLRKAIERIIQQVSVLETNIGSSTTGNSANTQIIFNDNGTLRGDAGLTYNKTTDLLTVGAATITGDLTVDTSTLKVDSANDRVGIGTVTPDATLDVTSAGTASTYTVSAVIQDGTYPASGYPTLEFNGFIGGNGYRSGIGSIGGQQLAFYTPSTFGVAPTERYRIASDGVATWSNVGGVAGTAMTLNSTGLGIGAAPEGRLNVANTAAPVIFSMTLVGAQRWQQIIDTTAGNWTLRDQSSSIDALIVKAGSGNLGVGVVPSAKLDVSANDGTMAIFRSSGGSSNDKRLTISTGGAKVVFNISDNSNTATARAYEFQTAGSAAMTLDASGNVGIGVTPSAWSAGKALEIGSAGNALWSGTGYTTLMQNAVQNSGYKYGTTGAAAKYDLETGTHKFFIAASGTAGTALTWTQAMTLTADGELLVGTASVGGVFDTKFYLSSNSGTNKWAVGPYGTATNFAIIPTPGTGGVYLSGTSATSWTAYSDERLKDIIEPITNALTKVGSLRSVIGKFKGDEANTRRPFLIAQDLQSALPEAVDASNPDRLGVAYTDVIPLLVAAIKELTAEVNALKNA